LPAPGSKAATITVNATINLMVAHLKKRLMAIVASRLQHVRAFDRWVWLEDARVYTVDEAIRLL
jgi:hypothetical protein